MSIPTTKTATVVLRGNPVSATYQPDPQELADHLVELATNGASGSDLDALDARVTANESAVSGNGIARDPVAAWAGSNITLSGTQTVDGVTLSNGDRVGVGGQTASEENGVYAYNDSGAWTRVADMDASGEISLSTVFVSGGTTYGGRSYRFSVADPDTFTLDTDAITATQVGDGGALQDQIDAKAPIDSPAFTSAATLDGDDLATQEWVAVSTPNLGVDTGAPSLINAARGTSAWKKSTALATFETQALDSGARALHLAHSSSASVDYTVPRDASEDTVTFRLVLHSKTGTNGRVQVIEMDEPEGVGASSGTILATTTVDFPSGDVSTDTVLSDTVTLNASTSRLVFRVELQSATDCVFTPSVGYGDFAGPRAEAEDIGQVIALSQWPNEAGIPARRVSGAIIATTEAISGTTEWYVNGDDDLEIVTGENAIRVWTAGQSVNDLGGWEIVVSATETGGDVATGPMIAVGSGASRLTYGYLGNGFVGTFENDGTSSGAVQSGMSFAADEQASLRLVRRAGGAGYIEATAPDGTTYREDVTGIPTGDVGAAWRRATTGKIHRLTCVPLSESHGDHELRLAAVETAAGINAPKLLGWHILPDAVASRDPMGYTCTGSSVFLSGVREGLKVDGDDGRLVEGDASPFDPRLVILDGDRRTIVETVDLSSFYSTVRSVQGVACDSDGGVWIATSDNDEILKLTPGADIGDAWTEVTGDAFDWNTAGYSGAPNGLCYDPDTDSLYAGANSGTTVYNIDCNPAASPREIGTLTFSENPDQMIFVRASETTDGAARIIYTTGGNGSAGEVRVYNLDTDADTLWTTLPNVEAIEGGNYDPVSGIADWLSDGGYHTGARPRFNQVSRYQMPPLP